MKLKWSQMETGETNETRLIACLLEIDTNIYSFISLDNIISFINSENQKNFKWMFNNWYIIV